MGKKSKQIGRENNNLIVDLNKSSISEEKKEKMKAKLAGISDEQLEKLFESGKITQSEYEAILEYRKKLKKKKTDKEKFEERIRCNNSIIQAIVNIGKKFRRQEIQYQKYKESIRDSELESEKDLQKEERVRSKSDGQRQMERGRNSGGRTRDR